MKINKEIVISSCMQLYKVDCISSCHAISNHFIPSDKRVWRNGENNSFVIGSHLFLMFNKLKFWICKIHFGYRTVALKSEAARSYQSHLLDSSILARFRSQAKPCSMEVHRLRKRRCVIEKSSMPHSTEIGIMVLHSANTLFDHKISKLVNIGRR